MWLLQIKECKDLITENQELEAFDILIKFTNNNVFKAENDILKVRLADWKDIDTSCLKGLITFMDARKIKNEIRDVLFKLIAGIEKKQNNIEGTGENTLHDEIFYLKRLRNEFQVKFTYYRDMFLSEGKSIYLEIRCSISRIISNIVSEIKSLEKLELYA